MGKKIAILLCLLATPVFAESGYNDAAKECLKAYGYDHTLPVEVRLNSFNFNKASPCMTAHRQADWKERIAKDRAFVAQRPWYKGKNWKWEEKAEYTCYHINNLRGQYEICSKPIYLN